MRLAVEHGSYIHWGSIALPQILSSMD